MSNKQNYALNFYNLYLKMSETDKEKFSRICSKLLDKTYLIQKKESDREDFFFCLGHLSLYQNYFMISDYSVTYFEADQIIALATDEDRNRIRLKRIDTIVLLVLRLLYYKKAKEVTPLNQMMISIGEIHNEVESTGLVNGRIPQTELNVMLRAFKSYSLINYSASNLLDDETRIELYPSLVRAVGTDDLNQLEEKLRSFLKGDDNDENDDQD
jgi:hypothetical protein